MTSFNDLTNNSELGSNGRYLVKSKKKEDALNASTQVWDGGLIVVVEYSGVNYVKITDGTGTFSSLKKIGEGDDGSIATWDTLAGKPAVIGAGATAAAARTAIGAGTSNLVLGTTAGTSAEGSTVVNLTTTQTIGGTKTFGAIPIIPVTTPTVAGQAISKSYFDTQTAQYLVPTEVLPTAPLTTNVAGGQVTVAIGPGTNGQALVTLGGVAVWGNQTANSVGAVATNMVGVANGVASLGATGFVPVGQLPNATTSARGVVLMTPAIPDVVAPPTMAEYNALLAALRTAGIITP